MEEKTFPDEKWDEVITAVRGSCEWCAAVARAVHICELIVLHGVEAPVLYGVGEDSAYEQLPAFTEKPGTVLIQRDLLIEKQNPGCDFDAKIAGFACVLAHEMAHHALRHSWDARRDFRQISALALEQRRWVLETLDAPKLAATTGLPYDVIVDHWAITEEAMRTNLLDYAANQSDEQAMRADETSEIEHSDVLDETGINIAEEWGAAVIGCMMRSRLERGQEYAQRIGELILEEICCDRAATLVRTVLMASSQNPVAEPKAIELAIGTLENAFHNSVIEECGEKLRQQNRGWKFLFNE